jgi:hypothetical protein
VKKDLEYKNIEYEKWIENVKNKKEKDLLNTEKKREGILPIINENEIQNIIETPWNDKDKMNYVLSKEKLIDVQVIENNELIENDDINNSIENKENIENDKKNKNDENYKNENNKNKNEKYEQNLNIDRSTPFYKFLDKMKNNIKNVIVIGNDEKTYAIGIKLIINQKKEKSWTVIDFFLNDPQNKIKNYLKSGDIIFLIDLVKLFGLDVLYKRLKVLKIEKNDLDSFKFLKKK